MNMSEMLKKMQPQRDEFDAVHELSQAYTALPAIVDDGYPEARRNYEHALQKFLMACTANKRLETRDTSLTLEQIGKISWQRALKWHEEDAPWTPERWVTAIAGELGEMANITKKLFRARDGAVGITQGVTIEMLKDEERKEWADTMHYMILFAKAQGWDMSDALREVFNAKSKQLGFVERL